MKRVLLPFLVFGVLLLTTLPAFANAGPPNINRLADASPPVAAIAGAAAAILVGFWFARRMKP